MKSFRSALRSIGILPPKSPRKDNSNTITEETIKMSSTSLGTVLLIIDPQNDFHEGGSLAVAGATADSLRLAELIRTHGDKIDLIIITLDNHNPEHIAHAIVWRDENGNEPSPFQYISAADVMNKKWVTKDESKWEHAVYYTQKLEEKGRFQLTIWPQHCIIDSEGQQVFPPLKEAVTEWEGKYGRKTTYIRKGMNNDTEMYSAVEAEVPIESDPQTGKNEGFIETLRSAKKVIVGGQALSHCVNYTCRDIVKYWEGRDPSDIIVLSDGSSPVYGCQQAATDFLTDMKNAGVTIKTVATAFD